MITQEPRETTAADVAGRLRTMTDPGAVIELQRSVYPPDGPLLRRPARLTRVVGWAHINP
jgi:hypothetical protein